MDIGLDTAMKRGFGIMVGVQNATISGGLSTWIAKAVGAINVIARTGISGFHIRALIEEGKA